MLESGRHYQIDRWPDDGEVYRLDGDVLVNETMPGSDLRVVGDRVLSGNGHEVCRVADLMAAEWPAPGFDARSDRIRR